MGSGRIARVPVPGEGLDGVLDKGGVVDAGGDDTVEPGQLVPEVGGHGGVHGSVPQRLLVGGLRGGNAGHAAVGALDDDGAAVRVGPGNAGWAKQVFLDVLVEVVVLVQVGGGGRRR